MRSSQDFSQVSQSMSQHRHKNGPHKRGELPSPAVVRAAANAACRFTRADIDCVLGLRPNLYRRKTFQWLAVSRSQVYAAFALRAIFEDGQSCKIAEMFGVKNFEHWMTMKDIAMKSGSFSRWWSDSVFMAVIEATEAFIAMEKDATVSPTEVGE